MINSISNLFTDSCPCSLYFSKSYLQYFQEEKEMAHLYERREFPYPGDEEAVEEFIKSGGALGTTIGPKGFADANMDSDNMQKQLQSKKFDQEAQKLWFRMRNEVVQELQEKGFDVE
jgi:hypothetical protein